MTPRMVIFDGRQFPVEWFLGCRVACMIDRPLGSTHPTLGFPYSFNYGFIPGVFADDGEELDAWVLGVDRPISRYEGWCTGILRRLNDSEDKLLLYDRPEPPPADLLEKLHLAHEHFWQTTLLLAQFYPFPSHFSNIKDLPE